MGLKQEQVEPILEAYRNGLGVEGAASMVTDEMIDASGFVIAGRAEKCAEAYGELVSHVRKNGFDHLIVGVPLGPDVPEAISLITRDILPSVL